MIPRKSAVLNAQTLLEFALVKRMVLADKCVGLLYFSMRMHTHITKSESAF